MKLISAYVSANDIVLFRETLHPPTNLLDLISRMLAFDASFTNLVSRLSSY